MTAATGRRGRPHPEAVAQAIARAFLAGPWEPDAMARRAGRALGDRRVVWLRDLALVVLRGYPDPPRDAPRELARFVTATSVVHDRQRADEAQGRAPWRIRGVPAPTAMAGSRTTRSHTTDTPTTDTPTPSGPSWPVPVLDDVGDLGEMLGLHPRHLAWFADVRSLERDTDREPLRHYSYRWMATRTGGRRLLEAPKPLLKLFQRRVLHEVLDVVSPHPAAHGFRPGRSVHTFVAPHVGRAVVVRIDLAQFFASVTAGRVFGLFRAAGYPEPVAHVLTGLVTNTVPGSVRRAAPRPDTVALLDAHRRMLRHLGQPHLPQGAPTSPALANLIAHGLDRRLTGLARSFGATYTRYADDLAFSGDRDLVRATDRLLDRVTGIVRAEGFRVNPVKTHVARAGERQRLAGLVVNVRPQAGRDEYDRLRAILHDARTNGPAHADRAGHAAFAQHLRGRIEWVSVGNPARGAKLRAAFAAVVW